MLQTTNMTFRIGHKPLVSDISVSFAPSKLHLIIGPNGAGKSTLIKVLARLLRPQIGNVVYEGVNVQSASEADLAKRRAVLSQAIEIAFPMTVPEVVMMGRYPHFQTHPGPTDHTIVDEVMESFEVREFTSRNYQTLSGGERQRVNFARVMAQLWHADKPTPHEESSAWPACRYLFLDEPLTFLDIRHQLEFMRRVRDFANTADVVTVGVVHDLNLAAHFADSILLMNAGRVVASGSPAEVLTAKRIRDVFGVEPKFVPVNDSVIHLIFE